jgi:hypothetical protein
MLGQSQITEKHRLKLVDWIIDISQKFDLKEETLFLVINLVDRYLSTTNLDLDKLQLLGCSAIFLGAKYQEIYPPELRDYVYVSNHVCKKEAILKMEIDILKKINYSMVIVSPLFFYNRIYFICATSLKELNSSKYAKLYFTGLFILELSLLEYKMIKYTPSIIASASMFLARKLLDFNPPWPKQVLSSQGFTGTNSINECVKELLVLIKNERVATLFGLRKKFSKESYSSVYDVFSVLGPKLGNK